MSSWYADAGVDSDDEAEPNEGLLTTSSAENKDWYHLSRMMPLVYSAQQRPLGTKLVVPAPLPVDTPAVERHLLTHSSLYSDLYSDLPLGALMSADFRGGSSFGLTPFDCGVYIWGTCEHVMFHMTKNAQLTTQLYVGNCDLLNGNIEIEHHYEVPRGDSCMPRPSHPGVMLDSTQSSALPADIAFFEVEKVLPDSCFSKFFVPSGVPSQPGEELVVLGWPGRVSMATARKVLATDADYARAKSDNETVKGASPMIARELFRLSVDETHKRVHAVSGPNGAFSPFRLSASPGTVHGANKYVIEHRCSTLATMSGAPCVCLAEPHVLVGIHVKGAADGERHNHAVAVTHPIWAHMYVLRVLPQLTARAADIFSFAPAALRTLHGYLDTVEGGFETYASTGSVVLAALRGNVTAFRSAHPSPPPPPPPRSPTPPPLAAGTTGAATLGKRKSPDTSTADAGW